MRKKGWDMRFYDFFSKKKKKKKKYRGSRQRPRSIDWIFCPEQISEDFAVNNDARLYTRLLMDVFWRLLQNDAIIMDFNLFFFFRGRFFSFVKIYASWIVLALN